MPLRLEELAKTIDHTLLLPRASPAEIDRLCEEACEHHFASVCVLPYHVPQAAELLRGCDVKVSTVVSFPHGADLPKTKAAAAEHCVAVGADEIAVSLNVAAMWSGEFRLARDELAGVVNAVQMRSVNTGKAQVLVKVVLDCSRLGDKRARLACKIVQDVEADFVETAPDDGLGSDVLHDVELLRERLSDQVAVKASGEIATVEEAREMLSAGAARLGTRHAVAILRGFGALRPAS
jgi:deoxyribose-phosphate aldolase